MIINQNNILRILVDMTRRDAMLGNSHTNLLDNELHHYGMLYMHLLTEFFGKLA